jgi:hypothetical protein
MRNAQMVRWAHHDQEKGGDSEVTDANVST